MPIIEVDPPPAGDDVTPAIQEAIDRLKPHGGAVVLPSFGTEKPWVARRPILLDGDNISVVGTVPGGTYMLAGACHPVCVQGFKPRNVSGWHWGGASCLDPSAGTRCPLRTRNDARGAFCLTPFDQGPPGGWPSVRVLTIDVGLVSHSRDATYCLLGMQGPDSHPQPFYLAGNDDEQNLIFVFQTAEHAQRIGRIRWTPPPGVPRRLTVELDLDACTLRAWVDGSQVATSLEAFTPGSSLTRNDKLYPFGLGGLSPVVYKWGVTFGVKPHDTAYFGLKFAAGRVYKPQGAQERIDGQPVNDHTRYFAGGGFAWLPLDELPSDRLIRWCRPEHPGFGYGLFLRPQDEAAGAVAGGDMANLFIDSQQTPVMVGTNYGARWKDCQFTGRQVAFFGAPAFVSHKNVFDRCTFEGGALACQYLWRWTTAVRDCGYRGYGRHALLLAGCNHFDYGSIVAESPGARGVLRAFDMQSGGNYLFEGGLWDFESRGPEEAYCDVEMHQAVASTSLVLRQMALGPIGAGKSLVVLRGAGPGGMNTGGTFRAADCWWGGNVAPGANGASVARVCCPGWTVSVEGQQPLGTLTEVREYV